MRRSRKRLVFDPTAGSRDQLAYALCLQVRSSTQKVTVILIDEAKMMRVQDRALDARQHPRVIAAREDRTLPESARPLWIVFFHPLRDLAVGTEHHRDNCARQPLRP